VKKLAHLEGTEHVGVLPMGGAKNFPHKPEGSVKKPEGFPN
jgi:hypothetical protein